MDKKLILRRGEQAALARETNMSAQQMSIYMTKRAGVGYKVAVRLEKAVKKLGIKGFNFKDFMEGNY